MTGLTVRVGIAAALCLASGVTADGAETQPGTHFRDCETGHFGGLDAPSLKTAIIKAVGPRVAREPDRFFSDNMVAIAPVGLRKGGNDVIVYVSGGSMCGSGGCNAYVLQRSAGTLSKEAIYASSSKISPARLPISLLPQIHNGRHDIGVQVAGGGVLKAYTAALSFNGRSYASNPTLPGARRVPLGSGQPVLDPAGSAPAQCRLR